MSQDPTLPSSPPWYKTFFTEILPTLHPFHPFLVDLSHYQALRRMDPQDVPRLHRFREILSGMDDSSAIRSSIISAILTSFGGLLFLSAFALPWIWEPESLAWYHWYWLFLGTMNILCGVRTFPWNGETLIRKKMELDHLEKWESERKKPLEGQADPVKMVQVECKV
ncbi:hypothetical protein CKM354_000853300 [Cercospora kikuchii]|uniref:Uncharacterized protein n=1 Tax=Cercospora kikuchii TaxID=84275 RepID=A0A9P3FFE9_9PEZI|nr:uncharacterized protein CKM354_000853300 [Cercospora kikuchii]GIZ45361.1 hypothetical protein CKM354_000853300 [Cercospora kikuchii]